MCNLFSSPATPPKAEPVVAAPVKKTPVQVKAAETKAVKKSAIKSNKEEAAKKGRKSFRVQLGSGKSEPKNGSGSGLSL